MPCNSADGAMKPNAYSTLRPAHYLRLAATLGRGQGDPRSLHIFLGTFPISHDRFSHHLSSGPSRTSTPLLHPHTIQDHDEW
jgi:hypothetical protein